jgi:acyl-CoA synthetase (AMP-forming)/AMP-acid ligase II
LPELLARRAAAEGERQAFVFAGRPHTFGELWRGASGFAAELLRRGVGGGDRVVVVLPNGPAFFHAFYGAHLAGAVPVPLFPGSGAERIERLGAACGARLVADGEESVWHLRTGPGADAPASAAMPSADSAPSLPDRDDVALLQYTSGSTGEPKGVVIRHRDLVTNVGQMIAGMEITAGDVFVSWLPVHHDMGLILMTMAPFVAGARLVLLPSGLGDVRPWLAAIDEHRGTFTAAPDFAYRLCLRAVRDPSRYDLASLRVALDAAEPVRASTIEGFEERFGLARVVVPGYGLAEATVGVSMQPPGTAPGVSSSAGSSSAGSFAGLVSIGRPFPGVTVRIVADGRPAAVGEVGEVVVDTPAACQGYFGDPEATAALFDPAGGVRTGDLGFRDAAGEVFLVGRSKNVIIQAGRNLAPQEIEEAAESLPFVRRAAAVGVDRGGAAGEEAHVFAELRRAKIPSDDDLHEMTVQVVERLHQRLGLRPGRVHLLRPRAIPRTPNGKIRHPELRRAYLDGRLRESGDLLFP